MALIDRLRRVGGIAKNRLASSVGALRGIGGRVFRTARAQARGLSVRVPRILGLTARAARLTTPLGLGITAATFAPQILRGGRVLGQAIGRGIAFFGGRQVVTAGAAGGIAGLLTRTRGGVNRPSERIQSPFGTGRRVDPVTGISMPAGARRRTGSRPSPASRRRAPGTARDRAAIARRQRRGRRKRIPTHRHKVISVPVRRRRKTGKRRTHRSPRHRGHKRVSFKTADGRKVSFLANPKARHR